ncbi:hypothetical protein VaNZ11_014057 [Volvox africanus]|uniref:PUA domain-containing protein n=1 Tax=Volvox africanus TaxID=51714 RepID=A0ABQ5SHU2_9CHLO|nr:hypothetical protein VaNZ11_014057 [Volvox africanus]
MILCSRGVAAGHAAVPAYREITQRRCAALLHATRPKGGVGLSDSSLTKLDGKDQTSSSSGRGQTKASDTSASSQQDRKAPKVQTRKKNPPPNEGTDNRGSGIDGLDELLADEDAVRQLRASLLSSLSAQHEQAVFPDQQPTTPPSTAASDSKALSTDHDTGAKANTRNSSTSSTAASGGTNASPLVILKKDKARLFVSGNPMVYGGAVDCVIARPTPGIGEPVLVADASRRPVGWGVFNPHSMFRVRLFQLQSEVDMNPAIALNVPALLQLRVRQAVELRRAMGLPRADTNVYRLINSEGDRLSGLVADVLGDIVVVQVVAGWVQRYRGDVESAIRAVTGLSRIVWRPMWRILEEEGLPPQSKGEWEGGKEEAEEAEGEVVEVREAGLRLLASPNGQKTGFYADQRDSRAFLAGLVRAQAAAGSPPALLDLCCYSGGFALAAAAAGAARVVGVDSSEPAVKLATANAQLNGLSATATFVRADISDFMKAAVAQGQQYDIVVLDPPKLAPDRSTLSRARIKYLRLNALAMRLVRPGGLLMTCSCSGAMTQSGDFVEMVAEASQQVGRQAALLREAGAAPDHVLNPAYPEGEYLTNLTLRLL